MLVPSSAFPLKVLRARGGLDLSQPYNGKAGDYHRHLSQFPMILPCQYAIGISI
jgi:hypothetical protein